MSVRCIPSEPLREPTAQTDPSGDTEMLTNEEPSGAGIGAWLCLLGVVFLRGLSCGARVAR